MKKQKALIKIIALALCVAALALMCSCSKKIKKQDIKTVGELAFDNIKYVDRFKDNLEAGCTVYINEAGELKPYLVLTKNYNKNGDTLLLRQLVMYETRYYNSFNDGFGTSYYNGCEIDVWLSNEFVKLITGVEIKESTINITSSRALARSGDETEDIVRQVFLLSWGEVGGDLKDNVVPANGALLVYFRNSDKRIANREGFKDSATPWSLRSVNTWLNNANIFVAASGGLGYEGVVYKNGIRPAFCIDTNTAVELVTDDVLGEIFVIKQTAETGIEPGTGASAEIDVE